MPSAPLKALDWTEARKAVEVLESCSLAIAKGKTFEDAAKDHDLTVGTLAYRLSSYNANFAMGCHLKFTNAITGHLQPGTTFNRDQFVLIMREAVTRAMKGGKSIFEAVRECEIVYEAKLLREAKAKAAASGNVA